MSPALFSLIRGGDLLERISDRLAVAGGVRELQIIDGMSAQEVDVLLRLEREDPK